MNWLIKMISKSNKNKRGFTLIELMVVVIVVGILAAAAIPIYRFAMSRAYSSEAKATIGTMLTSMKVFYAENNNVYPAFVWGESDETGGVAGDLMSLLGVDTDTNNWWHAGYEKGLTITETSSFGTVNGIVKPPVLTKITLVSPVGPLVWADGEVAPIVGIEVLYDVGGDKWYTGF